MGKNHYLGGSTLVEMGSDWFSGLDDPEPKRRTEKEKLERARKRSLQFANAKAKQSKEIKKLNGKQCAKTKATLAQRRKETANAIASGEWRPKPSNLPVVKTKVDEEEEVKKELVATSRKVAKLKSEEWRKTLLTRRTK